MVGVNKSTLVNWCKIGLPHKKGPRGPGGGHRFNLAEVRQWIAETGKRVGAGGDSYHSADSPVNVRDELWHHGGAFGYD